jgi:hypothetical protein
VQRAQSDVAVLQRRLQEATQASSSQVKSAESRALNAENVVEELRARMGEIHRLTAPSPLPTLGVRLQFFYSLLCAPP